MSHLEGISADELRHVLDHVKEKKPTLRLSAAIAYKHGVTQTKLAEWYGVQRRTIYNWLERIDHKPPEQAVTDDCRSGRPHKLTDEQKQRLKTTLRESPAESGYEALTWTPTLVRQYLAETFDVDYSVPSCRRLMKEAGLRYRNHTATSAKLGRTT